MRNEFYLAPYIPAPQAGLEFVLVPEEFQKRRFMHVVSIIQQNGGELIIPDAEPWDPNAIVAEVVRDEPNGELPFTIFSLHFVQKRIDSYGREYVTQICSTVHTSDDESDNRVERAAEQSVSLDHTITKQYVDSIVQLQRINQAIL